MVMAIVCIELFYIVFYKMMMLMTNYYRRSVIIWKLMLQILAHLSQEILLTFFVISKIWEKGGTIIELMAASEMMGFNFVVLYHESFNIHCQHKYNDQFKPIYLECHNGNNFNSLFRRNNFLARVNLRGGIKQDFDKIKKRISTKKMRYKHQRLWHQFKSK